MTPKSKNINQKKIEISIMVIDFSYKTPQTTTGKLEYKYNINLKHRVNQEQNSITVRVLLEIYAKKSKQSLCNLTVDHHYDFRLDKEKIKNPGEELLRNLYGNSISTTRGILFEKMRGTYLGDHNIPYIHNEIFNIEIASK